MFKKYWKLGLVVSMVFLIAVSVVSSVHSQAQGPFLIGVYGPMTGPASETGTQIKNGAIMAAEEINATGGILGRQIKLVFGDTESKPSAAVSMMERLINHDKVDLVTGGLHSDVALATMDITAKYGIPQVMNTPVSSEITNKITADPERYRYVIKNGPPPEAYGVSWAKFFEYMEDKQLITPRTHTVAFVRERTSYGLTVAASVKENLEKIGWQVVTEEVVELDQSDYLAILSKIKSLNPDVVWAIQTSAAAAASFVKQFRDQGIKAPLLETYVPNKPDFIRLAGSSANGLVWMVSIGLLHSGKGQEFIKKYEERWDMEPAMTAGLQYDLMHMIRIAYTIAGSFDKDEFIEAFLRLKYNGTTGTYAYNVDNHEVKYGSEFIPQLVYQIQDQKSYVIWPARYAETHYVTPSWLKE